VQKIAKIISLFEQIETPKEWEDVFLAARITHENFNKQQRIMRNNKIKEEERQKNAALKAQWKEGDRVKFRSTRYWETCMGVIIKRNPKRAKIQVHVGKIKGVWAVPYGNLTKIVDNKEIAELAIGKMEG
jgi:transcription antitermination factor NusG